MHSGFFQKRSLERDESKKREKNLFLGIFVYKFLHLNMIYALKYKFLLKNVKNES